MPRTMFVADAQATTFGLAGVEALADRYDVSFAATSIRFVQGWPEPAAFLVFEVRQKPSQQGTTAPPALRLQWSTSQGFWPFLRRHKSVDEGDVFDRALQGEIVYEPHAIIHGLARHPMEVEAHARLAPYDDGRGLLRTRVVALLRTPRT